MANRPIVGQALDYSGARPSPQLIRDRGYDVVLRYLGDDWKGLGKGELQDLFDAGVRVALLGQRGQVDRPRGGRPQGRADGNYFEQWANYLRWPDDKPIICAIGDVGDPDGSGPKPGFPLESDLPAIREYFQGITDTNRRPLGIYGPYWVLEAFRGDARVKVFMQSAGGSGSGQGTGGTAFNAGDRSYRRLSDLTSLYQEYGSVVIPDTDHNQIYDPDFRRWSYHPDDDDKPAQEEDDMPQKIIISSKPGSAYVEEVLGVGANAQGHAFVVEGTDVMHLGPDEIDLLRALIYLEAVGSNPPTRPSIVDSSATPLDDVWFTTGHRFKPRP
jgi:hypothetical protein